MQARNNGTKGLLEVFQEDLLPASILTLNQGSAKPARIDVQGLGPVAVYLWSLTSSRLGTGRPPGEMRVQLIVPGYRRGARQSLIVDDIPTIILGYSAQYNSYCIWDARHRPFPAYSSNLQATVTGCVTAAASGVYLEDARAARGSVVWRLYCSRNRLGEALISIGRHVSAHGPEVVPTISA